MKKYFSILMLLAVMIISACSSDSGTKPSKTEPILPAMKYGDVWRYQSSAYVDGISSDGHAGIAISNQKQMQWKTNDKYDEGMGTTYQLGLVDDNSMKPQYQGFFIAYNNAEDMYYFAFKGSLNDNALITDYKLSISKIDIQKLIFKSEKKNLEYYTYSGLKKYTGAYYFDMNYFSSNYFTELYLVKGIGLVSFKYKGTTYEME